MLDTDKKTLLSQLLHKQIAFYKVILEISQTEHELFSSERPMNEIMPLMKKKKILLTCIEEAEAALQPLKNEWESCQQAAKPGSQELNDQFSALGSLIKEIVDLDKNNAKLFEKSLKILQSRGKKIASSIKAKLPKTS